MSVLAGNRSSGWMNSIKTVEILEDLFQGCPISGMRQREIDRLVGTQLLRIPQQMQMELMKN
jgi:hypothetical protein